MHRATHRERDDDRRGARKPPTPGLIAVIRQIVPEHRIPVPPEPCKGVGGEGTEQEVDSL